MKFKLKNIFLATCLLLGITGCGIIPDNSSGSSSGGDLPGVTNVTTVKMIKAEIPEGAEPAKIRNIKKLNDETSDVENENLSSENSEIEASDNKEETKDESSTSNNVPEPIVEGPQYVIIYREITDITLTITLDNPEAYGIDALRVSCDDPNSQIQVEGEWKPIAQENDGTRVVNWSSEDPYEKTFNIRTTSLEDLYTFKVVDIRLAGESKFLSKMTNSTDFGNNELEIYKMDKDAYKIDVAYNTFEEIKFGIKVKDGITNLSNFKVAGQEPDEDGYWIMTESVKDCDISYDFELGDGSKVRRHNTEDISLMTIKVGSLSKFFATGGMTNMYYSDSNDLEVLNSLVYQRGYLEIALSISGTGVCDIPEMWIGETKLENVNIARCFSGNGGFGYMYYCFSEEFGFIPNEREAIDRDVVDEYLNSFRFMYNGKTYMISKTAHNKYVEV